MTLDTPGPHAGLNICLAGEDATQQSGAEVHRTNSETSWYAIRTVGVYIGGLNHSCLVRPVWSGRLGASTPKAILPFPRGEREAGLGRGTQKRINAHLEPTRNFIRATLKRVGAQRAAGYTCQ